MNRILVSDVDGTISHYKNGNCIIDEETKNTISILIEKYDFKIIFASGRSRSSLLNLLRDNNLLMNNCYFIVNNGAQVLDNNMNCIFENKISNATLRNIIDWLNEKKEQYPSKVTIAMENSTLKFNNHCNIPIDTLYDVYGICIELLDRSDRKVEELLQDLNVFFRLFQYTEINFTLTYLLIILQKQMHWINY